MATNRMNCAFFDDDYSCHQKQCVSKVHPQCVDSAGCYTLSLHAQMRAAQRGLTQQDIDYVLQYGRLYHAGNAFIYYLRNIDIPNDDPRHMQRLEGTAVIMDQERPLIITAWRGKVHGIRNIRRKLAQVWRKEKVPIGLINDDNRKKIQ